MKNYRIGMVGVGFMGLGIATNLLKGGLSLGFLQHEGNQPTGDLVAQGAIAYGSAKDLAANSDIVIICVTGSPQVEQVLTMPEGILAGLKPDTIIVDCSTAIPSSTKVIAEKVVAKGGRFLDAPMTRTPKEAMEGRLNLIVGGEKQDFEEVLPCLQIFAENITHVGGIGDGHTMKLLHNYVSLGFAAVLSEAAASAGRAGVDPERFVEVLAKGGGGGVVLDRLKPFILDQDPSGLKFTISNAHKDIGYYNSMTKDLEAVSLVSEGVFELLKQQMEGGQQEKLMPELISLLQK